MNDKTSATNQKPSQKFPRNSKAFLNDIEGTVVYVNDATGIVRLECGHWKAKVQYTELQNSQENYEAIMYEVR